MEQIDIREDGLQLDEDRRFQEVFWTIERAAWIVFALIIALALAGFTGAGGPLAKGETQLAGAEISYPRILRWDTAETMTIRFPAGHPAELRLSPALLSAFELQNIVPAPSESRLAPDGLHLSFDTEPGDTAETATHTAPVTLALRPESAGAVRYELAIGGQAQTLTAFVMP